MKCRHCNTDVTLTLIDLGSAPPSNAYLTKKTIQLPEKSFPLRVMVCEQCWLVQTEDFANANELFTSDYAYFSAVSSSWLAHCKKYVDDVVTRFSFNSQHFVVEVASNDGYLLQYVKAHNIPCMGIEPTASTAKSARKKGVMVVEEFFGTVLAKKLVLENKQADLMIANNVLAHVPDINDFVSGFGILLKENGVATFEFPHLLNLIEQDQFDTIYHEHFSYLSFTTVSKIFAFNGLSIFDIEELPTHGGSLRVFAQKTKTKRQPCSPRVVQLLEKERVLGVTSGEYYARFQNNAIKIKNDFLDFLLHIRKSGKKVIGYGAAAKGNTLMNFASINTSDIECVIDRSPEKQGKMLPGSRIPVYDEAHLKKIKPDYIIIFPWNLKREIVLQLQYVKKWGAKFVTVVPRLEIT